jgi:hypothetical protein
MFKHCFCRSCGSPSRSSTMHRWAHGKLQCWACVLDARLGDEINTFFRESLRQHVLRAFPQTQTSQTLARLGSWGADALSATRKRLGQRDCAARTPWLTCCRTQRPWPENLTTPMSLGWGGHLSPGEREKEGEHREHHKQSDVSVTSPWRLLHWSYISPLRSWHQGTPASFMRLASILAWNRVRVKDGLKCAQKIFSSQYQYMIHVYIYIYTYIVYNYIYMLSYIFIYLFMELFI